MKELPKEALFPTAFKHRPDELDKELESRGHKFVRYADDFRIYCKSLKAAERVKRALPGS